MQAIDQVGLTCRYLQVVFHISMKINYISIGRIECLIRNLHMTGPVCHIEKLVFRIRILTG